MLKEQAEARKTGELHFGQEQGCGPTATASAAHGVAEVDVLEMGRPNAPQPVAFDAHAAAEQSFQCHTLSCIINIIDIIRFMVSEAASH